MKERDESIRDPVRRTIHELTPMKPASLAESLTGPAETIVALALRQSSTAY